jgi:hypothetical protein
LINSISLEFEPAPPPANPKLLKSPPNAHAQSHGIGDWLIAFGELAIIGGVLATLIKQFRRRQVAKRQQPQPEFLPVSLPFAPPLQPSGSADGQPLTQPPWATAARSVWPETVPSA